MWWPQDNFQGPMVAPQEPPPNSTLRDADSYATPAGREFQERPDRVTRAYVVEMLTHMFRHFLPADVIPPMLRYLVGKGVLKDLYHGVALPEGHGDLASYPADARAHLHRAIIAHANSEACPAILRDVLLSGALAESTSVAASRRVPDMELIERVLWDRSVHVDALSDFGRQEAHRVFEVITYLMVGKPVPPPAQPEPDDRTDLEKTIDRYVVNIESARKHLAKQAAKAAEHRRQLLADLEPASVSLAADWKPAAPDPQHPNAALLDVGQTPTVSISTRKTAAQAKRDARLTAIREILTENSPQVPRHKDIVKGLSKRGITCKVNTVTHDLRAIRRETR